MSRIIPRSHNRRTDINESSRNHAQSSPANGLPPPALGILDFNPIQYHTPLYQRLAARGRVHWMYSFLAIGVTARLWIQNLVYQSHGISTCYQATPMTSCLIALVDNVVYQISFSINGSRLTTSLSFMVTQTFGCCLQLHFVEFIRYRTFSGVTQVRRESPRGLTADYGTLLLEWWYPLAHAALPSGNSTRGSTANIELHVSSSHRIQ